MDFQSVPSPTNYGAPNVFQQQGQQPQQGQPQQGGQQDQVAAALAKAKQLLSSGQMSPDQYSQLTAQLTGGGPANVGNIAPAADTLNLGLGQ